MPIYRIELTDWLATPAGLRLRQAERAVAMEPLRRVCGRQLLQVGAWGAADEFTALAGTVRRTVCAEQPLPGVGFVAESWQLPVASQAVDAVLLPHTLERSGDPHQVLRECERVLTGGGRLIVLGFNPWSLLGLRRLLSRGGWPPEVEHLFSERRLRDWLSLLNFDIIARERYLPVFADAATSPARHVRQWPGGHGGYLLVAVKRTRALPPLRRGWLRTRHVPVGLAKPSARTRL